jgi:hypothetical protein
MVKGAHGANIFYFFHNMLPTIEVIYFVQKSLQVQNKTENVYRVYI